MTILAFLRRILTPQRVTGGAILTLAATAPLACAAVDVEPDWEGSAGQDDSAIEAMLVDDNAPLLVKDPKTLMELEEKGLTFANLLGVDGATAKDLLASPKYEALVSTINADLASFRARDPQLRPGVGTGHRQFDIRWLSSPQSRFELVGLVNRLDRRHVQGCGEYRLIYRLAYTATVSASRLPMTVNVVFPQADDGRDCQTVAQRWLDAKNGSAGALLAGPLKDRAPFASIEVNLQSARWPSERRPDFGGHAEYVLRVFAVKGDTLEPSPLENTPRGNIEGEELEELRAWIGEHLKEIDEGTAVVPEKFLLTRATSVGPRGLVRDANRPFGRLFKDPEAAFGDLSFAATKLVKSPAALVRRLDTMTCNGCHQARAIAGFHMLGEERDNSSRLNALAIGRSPHFNEELAWRTDYLAAVAAGQKLDAPRPFAERGTTVGKYGAHCGLGDPGFAAWTCAEGLKCVNLHHDVVGICSPIEASTGDACETGSVTRESNPYVDKVENFGTLSCGAGGQNVRCNPARMGFPDGMCRVDCPEEDVGKVNGETMCGLVPQAAALTRCLTVDRKPFKECLSTSNVLTNLRTCDLTETCRDDYACMRVKNGPAGTGTCMPPYFAFQARVDGHIFD